MISDVHLLPYQILPNIIFILAVLGILLLILRRLPEAAEGLDKAAKEPPVELRLAGKGLPAAAVSKIKAMLVFWGKKSWNFMLEAKDLKPSGAAGYRIKKMLGGKVIQTPPTTSAPASTEEVKNEQYFLNIIKRDPKVLANYDALGKFYLDNGSTQDARDIYEYLAKHDAANADYHARLAFCYYQLKDLGKTSEEYQKSLALDSSQPNRYYNLGLVLEAQGRNEEAAEAIEQAVALEPNNVKFHISLGNVLLKLGDAEAAHEAYLQAKKIDPQNEILNKKLENSAVPQQ